VRPKTSWAAWLNLPLAETTTASDCQAPSGQIPHGDPRLTFTFHMTLLLSIVRCLCVVVTTRSTTGAWRSASRVSSARRSSWSCCGGLVRCRSRLAAVVWSLAERPSDLSGLSWTRQRRPNCPTTSCLTWSTRVVGAAAARSCRLDTTGCCRCRCRYYWTSSFIPLPSVNSLLAPTKRRTSVCFSSVPPCVCG